jgi:Zn finger protein HypA/HybF involved in hydrogenase expression
MTNPKRNSIYKALTLPLSILLFWQASGWIAFGILDPKIVQDTGQQVNAGLELTVGIMMAILTAALGSILLFYRTTVSQTVISLKIETTHKCLSCGYAITTGVSICPRCGSKTFF